MDDSRELIEFVNKLQKYFKSTGCGPRKIELPQIVVVGAQSSGKSSVLDGLVGFSILPRGSGTVTKCPIIVQLITISKDNKEDEDDIEEEGIELEDFPDDGRSQDYDQVRAKIAGLMERDAGAITDTPIIVRVYSPNVVTLTVVDLPGIKRLTSSGEPSDLEERIFYLSRKYINEKNAIILAVSPANYDICNSDGLLLAKEADPEGHRTIGVLTKLDLMDEGTNARDLLIGVSKDVRVKLGMIGLVNRSQKDIDNDFTVEQQMEKEKTFLWKHYPDLVDQNGVPYLRKRLHELLVQHILKCLPEILVKLEDMLKQSNQRVDDIPNVMTQKDQFAFVSKVIHRFEHHMKREIEGSPRTPECRHLYGGIVIKDIFEKRFAEDMESSEKQSVKSMTDAMVLRAFRNSGSYDSMFVNPEAVFRKLAQSQIQHIEGPGLRCAERVNDEIIKIAERNLAERNDNAFKYFPELRKVLKNVITGMLEENLDTVKKQITDYIRVQASIVFSLDAGFLQTIANLRRKLEKQLYVGAEHDLPDEKMNSQPPVIQYVPPTSRRIGIANPLHTLLNDLPNVPDSNMPITSGRDQLLLKLKGPGCINLIKDMVKQYFRLVKSHIQDFVPKLIADRLIIPFSDHDGNFGVELQVKVMENYESLTKLPVNVQAVREKDMELVKHLKEVIAEMKEMLEAYNDEEDDYGDDVEEEAGDDDVSL